MSVFSVLLCMDSEHVSNTLMSLCVVCQAHMERPSYFTIECKVMLPYIPHRHFSDLLRSLMKRLHDSIWNFYPLLRNLVNLYSVYNYV